MDHVEMYHLLVAELAKYRAMRYADLTARVGQSFSHLARVEDGNVFDVTVSIHWRDDAWGEIVVSATVAFSSSGPLHRLDDSFVMAPMEPTPDDAPTIPST